jgi:hypothetical protein
VRNVTLALVAWGVAGFIYIATHRVDTQFAMYWAFGLAFEAQEPIEIARHRADRHVLTRPQVGAGAAVTCRE